MYNGAVRAGAALIEMAIVIAFLISPRLGSAMRAKVVEFAEAHKREAGSNE